MRRNFQFRLGPPGYVITDRHRRRFASEQPQAESKHGCYHHLIGYDPDRAEYPRLPSYWFFDRQPIEAGILTSPVASRVGVGLHEWSEDNRREGAAGWITEGETVVEATTDAGVDDPGAAAAIVATYDECCSRGEGLLGRPTETLATSCGKIYPRQVASAARSVALYCVPLYPGGSNTCGVPGATRARRRRRAGSRPLLRQ